jgi:hypothetical protein
MEQTNSCRFTRLFFGGCQPTGMMEWFWRDMGQSFIASLNADTKVLAMSVFIEHIPTTKELENGMIGSW